MGLLMAGTKYELGKYTRQLGWKKLNFFTAANAIGQPEALNTTPGVVFQDMEACDVLMFTCEL